MEAVSISGESGSFVAEREVDAESFGDEGFGTGLLLANGRPERVLPGERGELILHSMLRSRFRRFDGLENTLVWSKPFVEPLFAEGEERNLAGVLVIGDFSGVGKVIVTLFDRHVEKELSSWVWSWCDGKGRDCCVPGGGGFGCVRGEGVGGVGPSKSPSDTGGKAEAASESGEKVGKDSCGGIVRRPSSLSSSGVFEFLSFSSVSWRTMISVVGGCAEFPGSAGEMMPSSASSSSSSHSTS